MKKFLLVLIPVVLILMLAAFYWFTSKRDYQSTPFWLASNEFNSAVIDHSAWQDILDEYLISDDSSGINLVAYQSLKREAQQDLANYIRYLTDIDPREYSPQNSLHTG